MKVSRLPYDPGPAAWNEILPAAPNYPKLEGNHACDVLVIGAGFAGLAAARRLRQLDPELSIILLDARHIAEGPAGRNSGFMIDLPHNLGSSDYAGSDEQDRVQTRLNREAIQFATVATQELSMPREAFSHSGKINAAATSKGTTHNFDYAARLEQLNEPYELLDASAMKNICGSSYYQSGLFTPGTALIQPALFVRHMANGLSQNNVGVFENSPVTQLAQEADTWKATTPKGNISAGKVVLAVNGHAESFGLFKRRLMHVYLYASMTHPLDTDETTLLGGEHEWAFTPADAMGTTVRRISGTGGDRIVVRNGFTWAPGRSIPDTAMKKWKNLHERSFTARFPQLRNTKMQYQWGGLLCLSRNSVPAFGERQPGLFTACCQNGLGTAMGTVSGKLAAELALGHKSSNLDSMLAFDEPRKLPPEPLAGLGANAVMHWSRMRAGAEL